jgi:hypothetical protein
VRTANTTGTFCGRLNRCHERCANLQGLAGTRPKLWDYRLGQLAISTVHGKIEKSVYAAEQDRALQCRSPAILGLSWLVACNQELIGSTCTKHFDPHQN